MHEGKVRCFYSGLQLLVTQAACGAAEFNGSNRLVLPDTAAHRTLCTMRLDSPAGVEGFAPNASGAEQQQQQQQQQQKQADNYEGVPLVDVTFKSHSAQEVANNPRVPEGVTVVSANDRRTGQ
eukprot:1141682-Pelagomonas_calceolata.AAC.6